MSAARLLEENNPALTLESLWPRSSGAASGNDRPWCGFRDTAAV
jgi:hypothetical protein